MSGFCFTGDWTEANIQKSNVPAHLHPGTLLLVLVHSYVCWFSAEAKADKVKASSACGTRQQWRQFLRDLLLFFPFALCFGGTYDTLSTTP